MNKIEYMAISLPYGLKIQAQFGKSANAMNGNVTILSPITFDLHSSNKESKPILRPLSDLYEEIEHNGEKFKGWKKINNNENSLDNYHEYSIHQLPFWAIQMLVEWHFDICGLIEKGEAVDYHTLPDFVF